jgi:hypothetical protein
MCFDIWPICPSLFYSAVIILQILLVCDHNSADSPVLWLRLDPDMTLLRSTFIEQPDYQWQYQLRHERDVTAQMEAISALERYPTPASRLALTDTIENEQAYYKVRCRAAHCLTKVRVCCQYSKGITSLHYLIIVRLFYHFACVSKIGYTIELLFPPPTPYFSEMQ